MKKLYLFAALAAMLAACSENDLTKQSPQNQETAEVGAVTFEAYTQRPVTRAGQTGVLKIDDLKEAINLTEQNGGGFGVFGYYTDNNFYMPTRMPDFMYNQLVEWQSDKWVYSPIKYWPNEYGDNAISDDNDRVSFFAYAPYVATSNTGKVDKPNDTWGIVGMSRNSAVGDPLVKFIASFEEDKSVDLLWGVCDDYNWQLVNTGSIQQTINDGKPGLPWKDVQRPQGLNQKMKFTFKHALTQLSVFVDAAVDDFNSKTNELAAGTKIYVRSISFTGVTLKGTLNLNNVEANKALWLDFNGLSELTSSEPVTVYDGLKDGKEGTVGNKAVSEKIVGLNPEIISNVGNTTKGVVAATAANGGKGQKLFAYTPVMLIPTGEDMEVEIVYDVETEDPMLATLLSDGKKTGSSIENRIKKSVSFGDKGLENGKNYTLNLHLGMNSVKFDAEVSEWQESYEVRDADLPSNMPAFTAQAGTAAPNVVEISGNNQDYIFAVTGLTPNEAVTASIVGSYHDALEGKDAVVSSDPKFGTIDNKANASGIAYVKVAGVENTTVRNLGTTERNTLQVQSGEQVVKLQFIQMASPYELKVESVANELDGSSVPTGNDVITLDSNHSGLDAESWNSGTEYNKGWSGSGDYTTEKVITVKVNGKELSYNDALDDDNQFKYSNKVITVTGNLKVGDIVEVTIDNGEAPAETVVAKIGGLAFVPAERTLIYRGTAYDAKMPTWNGGEGETMGALTWTPNDDSNTYVNVDGTSGEVTTKEKTSSAQTITAVANNSHVDGSEWFYTTSSLTANYNLTINIEKTEIKFDIPAPAPKNINKAIGSSVLDNKAKVYGETDGELTSPSVGYAVTYVEKNGSPVDLSSETPFEFGTGADSHKLKVGATALDAHTVYEIEVTATYAGVANKIEDTTKKYSITVTTGD